MSEIISYGAKIEGGSTSTISTSAKLSSASSVAMPVLDTKEPRPKVKRVKVTPKLVVITCRCGGVLSCIRGIARGVAPTLWEHVCPRCSAHYEMEECAGEIIYG